MYWEFPRNDEIDGASQSILSEMQCNIKKVRKPVLGVGNTGSRRGNTLFEYITVNNNVKYI